MNLLLVTTATMLRNFEVAFLSVCWNIKLTLRIRKSRLEATADSLASVSSFPLPLFSFARSICKISKLCKLEQRLWSTQGSGRPLPPVRTAQLTGQLALSQFPLFLFLQLTRVWGPSRKLPLMQSFESEIQSLCEILFVIFFSLILQNSC